MARIASIFEARTEEGNELAVTRVVEAIVVARRAAVFLPTKGERSKRFTAIVVVEELIARYTQSSQRSIHDKIRIGFAETDTVFIIEVVFRSSFTIAADVSQCDGFA